jgi:cob(I)alamin adenosyltransferase
MTDQSTPDQPLTEDPRPAELRRADSLLLVNTGDGKGKSSAAFGVLMRSVARGWKVAVVQFIKSGDWQVGEEKIAKQLGVDWWSLGAGFSWDSEDLTEDQAIAGEAWRQAETVLRNGEYQLVILDEISYPINWGWIPVDVVVDTLRTRSPKTNVIVTGRDAPAPIVELADTVTEMRNVKHAYDSGIRAKKGIDY